MCFLDSTTYYFPIVNKCFKFNEDTNKSLLYSFYSRDTIVKIDINILRLTRDLWFQFHVTNFLEISKPFLCTWTIIDQVG